MTNVRFRALDAFFAFEVFFAGVFVPFVSMTAKRSLPFCSAVAARRILHDKPCHLHLQKRNSEIRYLAIWKAHHDFIHGYGMVE